MITALLTGLKDQWGSQLKSAGIHARPPFYTMKVGATRAKDRKVNFLVFDSRCEDPILILKLSRSGAYETRLRHEFETLQHLSKSPTLRDTIPFPIALFEFEDHLVMTEKCLPGIPLTALLRRHCRISRKEIEEDVFRALDWLQALHRETRVENETVRVSTFAEETIGAFDGARAKLPDGFLRNLRNCAAEYADLEVALTSSHGDFWPGNFLISRSNVGVIDWESYTKKSFPILDAFLFLTTYARTYPWHGWKWGNRIDAFRRSFLQDNWFSRILLRCFTRYLRCLDLPPKTAEVFFPLFLLQMSVTESEFDRDQAQAGRWLELLEVYAQEDNKSIFQQRRTPRCA